MMCTIRKNRVQSVINNALNYFKVATTSRNKWENLKICKIADRKSAQIVSPCLAKSLETVDKCSHNLRVCCQPIQIVCQPRLGHIV